MENKKEKMSKSRKAIIILMIIYSIYIFLNRIGKGYDFVSFIDLSFILSILFYIGIIIMVALDKKSILRFILFYPIANSIFWMVKYIKMYEFIDFIRLILCIAPYVVLVFIGFNKNKKVNQKLWFIPGILYIVQFILSRVSVFGIMISFFDYNLGIKRLTLTTAVWSIIMFLLGYYLSDKKKPKVNNPVNNTTNNNVVYQKNDGYIDMAMHVLLLLFTFGIWYLIWIYKTTTYAYKSNRESGLKLILCMFVPFYNIYWTYVTSKMLDDEGRTKGIYSEICTICVILQVFVPFVVPILMQSKVNTLSTTKVVEQPKEEKNKDVQTKTKAAEIKEYKELLDMGAITQEEYDKKKKELLK